MSAAVTSRILAKLVALGAIEQQVAEALRQAGIRGRRYSASTCRYLKGQEDLHLTAACARPVRTSLSERDYELINRLMPVVVAGWRKADELTLQHEAERLDGLPTSPVIQTMRAFVEAERALRAGRVVSRG
jgi:hypothetical protein